MTPQAKIAALRAALEISQKALDCLGAGKNTREFAMTNAAEALALTADDAEQATDLDDALSAVLWLYHRLPRGYERQPHIERVVKSLADATRTDGVLLLKELGRESATPAPIAAESDILARQVEQWRKEVARLQDLIATAEPGKVIAAEPAPTHPVYGDASAEEIAAFKEWQKKGGA